MSKAVVVMIVVSHCLTARALGQSIVDMQRGGDEFSPVFAVDRISEKEYAVSGGVDPISCQYEH